MNVFDIDAYAPAQMAVRVEKAGITEGNMDTAGWLPRNRGIVFAGNFIGALRIVGESDIVRRVVSEGRDPATTTAADVMSSPLVCVDVKRPVYEIYRVLAEKRIRHVVITDDGRQVGFVSVKDPIRSPIV